MEGGGKFSLVYPSFGEHILASMFSTSRVPLQLLEV
jgi:hypothetical protein